MLLLRFRGGVAMEEDARSRLKAAKEAIENQDYNAAGRQCKHVLKQDRNNGEAYLIFGKALMAQKHPAHAEMAFRKAIGSNSGAALAAWQGLADLHEETGDVEKLQEALEGARKLAQAASDVILLEELERRLAATRMTDISAQELAITADDDRQLQEQIQQVVDFKGRFGDEWIQAKLKLLEGCMLLITSRPSQLAFEVCLALCEEDDAGELFARLGLAQFKENRISRIRSLGSRFLHFYPQHGYAFAAIALVQRSASSTSNARRQLPLLQPGLRLESNWVTGWMEMAEAHLHKGAHDLAVDCVNQAMNAVTSWRAVYGLSLVVAELRLKLILATASVQDKPAEADKIFQEVLQGARAVADDSICVRALEGLAKISVAQGNLEEALSRLDSVVSIDPHSHWAIAEQGWLSHTMGHFGEAVRCLEQAVALSPDVAIYHHRLGLAYAGAGEALGYSKDMACKQLMLAATLDPEQADVFRDLGHHFRARGSSQKALSCYQKALKLNANDDEAGDALCDILEERNQDSVAEATCQAATEQSPRAFWAWRRRGFLQVQLQDWSGAVSSLQHALRKYPQDAELWEALGLAYRQLGMLTAALKAYSAVLVLGTGSLLFASLESGNILLALSMFSKAIDMFRLAMQNFPTHVVALFGLASALLGRARECLRLGAFAWSSVLLAESVQIAEQLASVSGHLVAAWKLLGDIQATYSEAIPCEALDIHSPSYAGSKGQSEDTLLRDIESWWKMQLGAAKRAARAYQHALHMCPSEGSLYVDLGLSLERVSSFEGITASNSGPRINSIDVICGGIQLDGGNTDCWTALGVVSSDKGLKQHALIQALRIDGDHSLAWALLGQLYLREGNQELAKHAFDRARSSDPLLSLPWAGMSFIRSSLGSKEKLQDALADCLYAIHLSPTVDVQLGLAKLAAETKQLDLLQVYVALEQVIQHAPHSPEAHNLRGLACESRSNFYAAIDAFRMARIMLKVRSAGRPEFPEQYFSVSINLARVLCKAGNITAAVREYERLAATGDLINDPAGMCGYTVVLWWDGQKDLAIATVQQAVESIGSKSTFRNEVIRLFSKLLYFKVGPSAALRDVHQTAKVDYTEANLCFTLLALAICSRQEHFLSKLLSLCSVVLVGERASEGHVLLTVARQILYPEDAKLVMLPLLKALHLRPDDAVLRAKLGEVVLESSGGQMAELSVRCCPATLPVGEKPAENTGIKCLVNAALACSSCQTVDQFPIFSSCHDFTETPPIRSLVQRWLHKEPWNILPHVYLISEILMQAKTLGYPANLCRAVLRMSYTALALLANLRRTKLNRHFQLHLLICASESALQTGDGTDAISLARTAAGQTPAASNFSGGFIQLARCYAAVRETNLLRDEVSRLTSLHPDDILGWIALAVLQRSNGLREHTSPTSLENAIQKMGATKGKVWSAVLQVVRTQGFLEEGDLASAEKLAANALATCPSNSVLRLLHGALALELAKAGAGVEFWSSAARSLAKVSVGYGQCSLPIVHALLAEAEAASPSSHTSNTKFQKNVRTEWFSWPSECRPAELYFRMGLLARKSNGASTGIMDGPETIHTAKSWMLHAVHLNPTALRYWKTLPPTKTS